MNKTDSLGLLNASSEPLPYTVYGTSSVPDVLP